MSGTIIGGLDLSSCLGLELVRHDGPSSIGTDTDTLEQTLRGSGGSLALSHRAFFTAAGVSSSLVDAFPSLFVANPVGFYRCFISYATTDEAFVNNLNESLRAAG